MAERQLRDRTGARKTWVSKAAASSTDLATRAAAATMQAGVVGFGTSPPPETQQAMRDQGLQVGGAFSPGQPIGQFWEWGSPPRQWDFPTGYNTSSRPRAGERGRVSFETLEQILKAYDVARLCIEHVEDDLRSLEWSIQAKEGVEDDVADQVKAAQTFWSHPDGTTPFDSWQQELLEDILRFDAGTLYRHRTRGGQLGALEIVSGVTVAPLLDWWGRVPRPPAPAYVQYVQGIPAVWLTTDDLIYSPYRSMPESPYGLPPIEWLLLTANTDIRFQWHFLQWFTEGSVPDAFMEAPPDQSDPVQIKEFQAAWDAAMEGNQAEKHKVRWTPAGSKPYLVPGKNFDPAFPLYLMRKCAAAFKVTPHDLGFVEDVNRSSGETQMDVQFRIGTLPRVQYLQRIYTAVTNVDLGLPDVQFVFDVGGEKEDRLQEAQVHQIYIQSGVESADEVRSDVLGLPVDNENPTPRFVLTRAGIQPLRSLFEDAGPIDATTAGPEPGSYDPMAITEAPPVAALPAPAAGPEAGPAPPAPDQPTAPTSSAADDQPQPGKPKADAVAKAEAEAASVAGLAIVAGDTGRVLMIQRSIADETDPAAGTWEFPGGHVEDGEAAEAAARREWSEETGAEVPAGEVVAMWTSPNGVYRGFVYLVPTEADVAINLDAEDRHVLNPDDPDHDDIEVAAWWDPRHVPTMPALRPECWASDWQAIMAASAGARQVAKELGRWRDNARKRVRGGRPPRQFSSDVLPDELHAAVWAQLEKATTAEEVDDAFRRVPFRKAARARPLQPQQEAAEQHYADQVLAVLRDAIDVDAVAGGWAARASTVEKAAQADDTAAEATAYAQTVQLDLGGLPVVLSGVYRDGWTLGLGAGLDAMESAGLTPDTATGAFEMVASMDWSSWTPGNPPAAAALSGEAGGAGLAELLAQDDVTIAGVSDSLLQQLGGVLADGARAGDSVDSIGRALRELLEDPARAELVAHTELARAVGAASLETYRFNEVPGKAWITFHPCPICETNEEAGAIPLDENFPGGVDAPPQHPRCRCALVPEQLK